MPGALPSPLHATPEAGAVVVPTWRGRLHLGALWCSLPLVVALVIEASGARARGAVLVYAVGLCSVFAVSATYHRFVSTQRAKSVLRRADHATIFVAIAGTFTALALTTLGTVAAVAWLVVMWAAAGLGALVQLTEHPHADRIGSVMYLATGWAGCVLAPSVWTRGGHVAVGLLVLGGVLYTVGALGFVRRWPTLRPATFSYHEVWHVFTIVAAATHFGAIWIVAT